MMGCINILLCGVCNYKFNFKYYLYYHVTFQYNYDHTQYLQPTHRPYLTSRILYITSIISCIIYHTRNYKLPIYLFITCNIPGYGDHNTQSSLPKSTHLISQHASGQQATSSLLLQRLTQAGAQEYRRPGQAAGSGGRGGGRGGQAGQQHIVVDSHALPSRH